VRAYGLDVIAGDRLETWVRMPDTAVTFGRRAFEQRPFVEVSDDTAARRHCELRPSVDGGWLLLDVNSSGGTFLEGGPRLEGPYRVPDGGAFFVGAPSAGARVRLHAADPELAHTEATEHPLLVAIAEREPGADDVYLDWLEQRGPERAALWRLVRAFAEVVPVTRPDSPNLARRIELARRLDTAWRARIPRAGR
jgi:hypothetical protein